MRDQFTLRLPRNLLAAVAREARRRGVSRADVARIALRRFLGLDRPGAPSRPMDLVRDLIGVVASGVPDLGSDHRKHLKGRIRDRR